MMPFECKKSSDDEGDDGFTFPDVADAVWKEQLSKTHSIRDFQCNFIYHTIQGFRESSDGLTLRIRKTRKRLIFVETTEISFLDTTLLNVALFEHGLVMTASIGDNLVQKIS
jgi:hypothetical protein